MGMKTRELKTRQKDENSQRVSFKKRKKKVYREHFFLTPANSLRLLRRTRSPWSDTLERSARGRELKPLASAS